ncbi:MAG: NAD(P)-binding domain-containing protein [Lachnospiraceae bacterium]|nr:NAD(P)-binding domain-containing protein [Lachnospiraceae bacterium]
MKTGILGYGSMGKMLLWKFFESGVVAKEDLYVANRTAAKVQEAAVIANVCTNVEAARACDILFVCVRPADIKIVLDEIKGDIKNDALVVSLNGSVRFEHMERITKCKMAKVIPSVTAEINRSQSLVCYNELVTEQDKAELTKLLKTVGDAIELPEAEMGMGSELASCMPGFIASIFDVICRSAKKHTTLSDELIVKIVMNTMSATGELMLQKNMTFEDVVNRVATPGGITMEGTKVVYEGFPETADLLFEKTLAKRRVTAENAEQLFN